MWSNVRRQPPHRAQRNGLVACALIGLSWIQLLPGNAFALNRPANLRYVGTQSEAAAKPTAANTGWQPTGVTLTPSGAISVTKDGTVIDSKDVAGEITIQASNVIVRRCRVRSASYYPIRISSGTNILIEDTEVDGMGGASKAVLIEGGQVTLRRMNIHDSEDGLSLNGSGGLTIVDNYVHSPRHSASGHSDGFELYSGAHMVIRNNNFDYAGANTSASNFSNWAGAIDDVTYDHNWLSGGTYNLYIDGSFSTRDAISNIRVTNNRWIRGSAVYGTHVVRGTLSNIVWSGNVFDDNDEVISK